LHLNCYKSILTFFFEKKYISVKPDKNSTSSIFFAVNRYFLQKNDLKSFVKTHFFIHLPPEIMIQNKKTFASFLFVLISFVCFAQNPPPPQPPPSPVGLPIDTNILILVILGFLYGIYKIYRFRKKKVNI